MSSISLFYLFDRANRSKGQHLVTSDAICKGDLIGYEEVDEWSEDHCVLHLGVEDHQGKSPIYITIDTRCWRPLANLDESGHCRQEKHKT